MHPPGHARRSAHLVLIGLRGSGKTTLRRALADRLGRAFVDLDDVTPEVLACQTVRSAFSDLGESAFRKGEVQALIRTLKEPPRVLALGGGTPTAPGAETILREARERGQIRIVYLRAGAHCLRDRLARADNADRPSLTGMGVLEEIEMVLAQRDPLYSSLSDINVPVDGKSIEQCVQEIARSMEV